MFEVLKCVTIEMGARTGTEVAEDLEAIVKVLRSGEGVAALPQRLMLEPRAVSINIQVKPKWGGNL